MHTWLWWTIPTLNTRETAAVTWFVGLLAAVLIRPSTRPPVVSILRTLTGRPLSWVFLASGLYVAAVVAALGLVGYWQTEMLGETVLWFTGTALLATTHAAEPAKEVSLRGLLARLIAMAAVLEFLANVHTFILPLELVLIPAVALLAGGRALAEATSDQNLKAGARPIAVLTFLIAAGVLGSSAVYLAVHLGRFGTPEYLRSFLLPLILGLIYAPFLYGVGLVVAWQTSLSMLKMQFDDQRPLYLYVRRRLVRLCGLSLKRVQLFESGFRRSLRSAADESAVEQTLLRFRKAALSESDAFDNEEADREGGGILGEALSAGLDLNGIISASVGSATRVQTELATAGEAAGQSTDEMRALADRVNENPKLASVPPLQRVQMIRLLAERSRSLDEIEDMVGPIAQLAVLEGVDPLWLAGRFDIQMRVWDEPSGKAEETASTLHGTTANSSMTLADLLDALDAFAGISEPSSTE